MPTDTPLTQVRKALGMSIKEFATEWRQLPDKDKDDIRTGVLNGSLTY